MRNAALATLATLLAACGSAPPPSATATPYVEAPIVPFHVTFVDGSTLSLADGGVITLSGDVLGTLGADGRIESPAGETIAALLPDGRLSFHGSLSGLVVATDGLERDGTTAMRLDGDSLVATATTQGDGTAATGSVPVVGVTPASRSTVLFVVAVADLSQRAAEAAVRVDEADALIDQLVQGESPRVQVPIADHPVRGGANAAVTIAMFLDFQCPFCGRVQAALHQVAEHYGDDVRFVFFHNPLAFHDHAHDAATFVEEARAQRGDPGFWAAYELLFAHQQNLTRDELMGYAQQLGLDATRLDRAFTTDAYQQRISADQALAMRIGATGTPGFAIDGLIVMGAQPYEQFAAVLDAELDDVHRLEALGVARADIYDRLLARSQIAAPIPPPSPPSPAPQPDPSAVYAVPLDGRPAIGPADALVTIVAFSDFQCPFCSRVLPTLAQLRTDYGRDLRIVFRNNPLPFHEHAMEAAEAAAEAFAQRGDAGFWQMHDALFAHQDALTRADLERYATEMHLSLPRFQRALDQHTHRADIEADVALAQRLGATGTPSFFVNGRMLRGAQPLDAFHALIDEVMQIARTRVASGTPRRRVYDAVTHDGATQPVMLPGSAPTGDAADDDVDTHVYTLPIPHGAPTLGSARARVTVQIFSDFQCPFCGRVEPTLVRLREHYGDRVRFVWRNYPLPFHDNAMPAAEAALEVLAQRGVTVFWSYHDLLFANQQNLTRADLERYAGQIHGIDMTRFRQALDDHRHVATIQADMDAITRSGAQIGTPSFFIEGHLLMGAQPYERFTAMIDPLLGGSP